MAGTKAIVETNNGGTNNVVDFTYREEGIDGNLIPIQILAPAVAGQVLAIDYSITKLGSITITPASTDGSTITTTGTLLVAGFNGTKAANVLTSNNTNPTDGDSVKIGGTTYRFKTTTAAINDIFIGASADATLTSLAAVLNGTATIAASGADAFTGTKNGHQLVSSSAVSGHALTITARWAGVPYNAYPTTVPVNVGATYSWAGTTLGGAGATAGVDPLDVKSSRLFTAAGSGTITGILAAGTFTYASTGSTAGVGTTYDSALTANAAGWIMDDNSVGSVAVATPDNLHLPTTDRPFFKAFVFSIGASGQHSVNSDTAAHLLTACKSFAINKAAKGEARNWAPQTWYPPTLWAN